MSRAAIVATGAISALGRGPAAYAVGEPGACARTALRTAAGESPFGHADGDFGVHAERPARLLTATLEQLLGELERRLPGFRELSLGVVIGSSSGGFAALEELLSCPPHAPDRRALAARGAYFSPVITALEATGFVPQLTVALYGACASATLSLGLAARWLELGRFQLVIAGGYDAESRLVRAGFASLRATCSGVPRPFRRERDGLALGEGAGLLALVSSALAERLQIESVWGFVDGFAATTDAVHITAPERGGTMLALAAEQALRDAELEPLQVGFVSPHATGTVYNDAAESQALLRVFGSAAARTPLHALKPSIGHTLGAAGALESLSALDALKKGVIPASCSDGSDMFEFPARLLAVNRAEPVDHCLKLSTAFGGANAALVLSCAPRQRAARLARPVRVLALGRRVTEFELTRVRPKLRAPIERLPRSDDHSLLCIAAAAEALGELEAHELGPASRVGAVLGSAGATLERNAAFAKRALESGLQHAEPRRFPATSPSTAAGQVAIAFALHGPTHAVGAGSGAGLEALLVAHDWVAAGDADAMLVIAAEETGSVSAEVLTACGFSPGAQGAYALVLGSAGSGPALDWWDLMEAKGRATAEKAVSFAALEEFAKQACLPGRAGFGKVRAPE
jgi:3-oxoacyl-[acyl-carrier-protein] synthase-1/3-oxoacyl-[acyl-carrier-protein] synthase II